MASGTAAATRCRSRRRQTVYLVDLAALNDDAAAVVYAAVAGARAVLAYGFASGRDSAAARGARGRTDHLAHPRPQAQRGGPRAVCATRLGTASTRRSSVRTGAGGRCRQRGGRTPPSGARPAADRRDVPVSGGARAGRRRRACGDRARLERRRHRLLGRRPLQGSWLLRPRRRAAVLPAGDAPRSPPDETLAPAAGLAGLFGLPRGAPGP